jgi:hypothetical protein
MEHHNKALLAKLGWKLLTNADLLWVLATKAKYLRNYDLLQGSNTPSASWIWKGIIKNMDIVSMGACRSFSIFSNFNVWNEPWVPSLPSFKHVPCLPGPILPNMVISDLIDSHTKSWKSDFIFHHFDVASATSILNIHILREPSKPWFWASNASGLFSVGSAYDLVAKNFDATSGPLSTLDWNGLWSLKMQNRHKHLLWRIAWNVLPVRVNLFKFMPNVSWDK